MSRKAGLIALSVVCFLGHSHQEPTEQRQAHAPSPWPSWPTPAPASVSLQSRPEPGAHSGWTPVWAAAQSDPPHDCCLQGPSAPSAWGFCFQDTCWHHRVSPLFSGWFFFFYIFWFFVLFGGWGESWYAFWVSCPKGDTGQRLLVISCFRHRGGAEQWTICKAH